MNVFRSQGWIAPEDRIRVRALRQVVQDYGDGDPGSTGADLAAANS